ncbi:MAG: N-acetylmuramoyl-L-alanine amidase [Chryseobacterium sp.]|nr:MAG: N-acetylmuramoyl-L-alanine amidase [Chryseobacterium sp.]
MRKSLYSITLAVVLASCATQTPKTKAPVPQPKPKVEKVHPTAPPVAKQPAPNSAKPEYYNVNIADAAKNDNTISYGSLVAANPQGYVISRTYFPAIGQNFRQRYLILHYTALDDDKSLTVLTQQSVSAHYLVGTQDDNEIYQLVDENKRAYHAGISSWRKDAQLNDTSIGIEIVNRGYTADAAGNRTFYAYPEHQFRKVAALAKDIVTRYMIPPTNVLGHSDVAPTRKQDPGPFFPWKRLYDEYGIGMWYDDDVKTQLQEQLLNFDLDKTQPTFITNFQQQLASFGYDLRSTGLWDTPTRKTIEAFQYHFRPQLADGNLDAETYAILLALLQKYPAK